MASWLRVPTPPGPESTEGKYEPDEERDLSFRCEGDMCRRGDMCRPGEAWGSWVRARSKDSEGFSRSE